MTNEKSSLRRGILNSALVKNPILFEAVGLSPVLAMTTSLKSAIILSVASCIELVIIELFACLLLKKVKRYLRMPIYALWGVILNLPIFAFFNYFTPNEAINAGIFLPLIAVNSLIALHCERYAVKHSFKKTFVDAIFASLGYALVIILMGIVREIIGNGTFYGIDLHFPVHLKGMLLPFGAFLLLGFMAATLKAILQKAVPNAHPERAFVMKEIKESHLGSFKSLLDTEFNPYADEEDEPETMLKPKKAKAEKKKGKDKASSTQEQTEDSAAYIAKPKQTEQKKSAKKKAEKQKSAKKKAKPEKKQKPAKPLTIEEIQKQQEREEKRKAREGYLLDFDEMLSDLDSYKKKCEEQEIAAVPEENETKGGDKA